VAVCPCQVSAQSDTSSSDHLLLTIDMEPISLSVILPVATLFLTKALEKTGEIFGEKAVKQVGKLKQLLQRNAPETATAIETVTRHPELAEANPSQYGAQALAARLQKIASADPEVAEAITSLANMVNAQPQSVQQNLTNIVGNVGVNAPDSTFNNSTFNNTTNNITNH